MSSASCMSHHVRTLVVWLVGWFARCSEVLYRVCWQCAPKRELYLVISITSLFLSRSNFYISHLLLCVRNICKTCWYVYLCVLVKLIWTSVGSASFNDPSRRQSGAVSSGSASPTCWIATCSRSTTRIAKETKSQKATEKPVGFASTYIWTGGASFLYIYIWATDANIHVLQQMRCVQWCLSTTKNGSAVVGIKYLSSKKDCGHIASHNKKS